MSCWNAESPPTSEPLSDPEKLQAPLEPVAVQVKPPATGVYERKTGVYSSMKPSLVGSSRNDGTFIFSTTASPQR